MSTTDPSVSLVGVPGYGGQLVAAAAGPPRRERSAPLWVWYFTTTVLVVSIIALTVAFYFFYVVASGQKSAKAMTKTKTTTTRTPMTTMVTTTTMTETTTETTFEDTTPTTEPEYLSSTTEISTITSTEPDTTPEITQETTSGPSLTTKSTKTTTTKKWRPRDNPFSFICIISIFSYTNKTTLPEDGFCDFIFLDSVNRKNQYQFSQRMIEENPIITNYVYRVYNKYYRRIGRKTRHGIGVDIAWTSYYDAAHNSTNVETAVRRITKSSKVTFMLVPDIDVAAFNNEFALSGLLFRGGNLAEQPRLQFCFDSGLFLGLTPFSDPVFQLKILENFVDGEKLYRTLISLSHSSFLNFHRPLEISFKNPNTGYVNNISECLIVPSMVYETTTAFGITHNISLNESFALMRWFEKNRPTLSKAISVSLKGRWYKPASPGQQNLALFKKCTNTQDYEDVAPYSVCKDNIQGTFHFDAKYKSPTFRTSSRIMTFETEESLKWKICSMKAKYPDMRFGIAVYDIDADDATQPCPAVKYTGYRNRLKLLKKLNDGMKSFTTLQDCLNIS